MFEGEITLGGVVTWLLVGLVVGAIARFLVPGRDPMGCIATSLLGIVGSFVGGTLASVLFEGELTFNESGLLGSIVGAILLVIVLRIFRRD